MIDQWPWLLFTGLGGLACAWVYVYFGAYWDQWWHERKDRDE